jgi:hypothetical protein
VVTETLALAVRPVPSRITASKVCAPLETDDVVQGIATGPSAVVVTDPTASPFTEIQKLFVPWAPLAHRTTQTTPLTVSPGSGSVMDRLRDVLVVGVGLVVVVVVVVVVVGTFTVMLAVPV